MKCIRTLNWTIAFVKAMVLKDYLKGNHQFDTLKRVYRSW